MIDEYESKKILHTFLYTDDVLVHIQNLMRNMCDWGQLSADNKKIANVVLMHIEECRNKIAWLDDKFDFVFEDEEDDSDEDESND